MKWKHLTLITLLVGMISACSAVRVSTQPAVTPTATQKTIPSATPAPTLTPTETATPTLFPTPEGEHLTSPLVRFSIFLPAGFKSITGMYRYQYSYAAVYQGEEFWEKAIAVLDMDVSDQLDLPLEIFLLLALDNLDYFNAAVEDTGSVFDIETNFPGTQAIDFTGNTKGVPIQGQIIGFKPDDDHVLIGLAWFDVSSDPEAWNNEGVYLFHFIWNALVIEE